MSDSIETIGARHGFSRDAAEALSDAIRRGGGAQAQFSHPDLGGMGQWTAGGMIMIGAMNDHALKARVAALAQDLSGAPVRTHEAAGTGATSSHGRTEGWPEDLGHPSTSGSQNGMRYAVFPQARRLAIEQDGRVTVYDTQDHDIRGASQSQGGETRLRLSSQHGDIDLERLPRIS